MPVVRPMDGNSLPSDVTPTAEAAAASNRMAPTEAPSSGTVGPILEGTWVGEERHLATQADERRSQTTSATPGRAGSRTRATAPDRAETFGQGGRPLKPGPTGLSAGAGQPRRGRSGRCLYQSLWWRRGGGGENAAGARPSRRAATPSWRYRFLGDCRRRYIVAEVTTLLCKRPSQARRLAQTLDERRSRVRHPICCMDER